MTAPEKLGLDIHRIIGTALSDEQLTALLELKPLSLQSLNRFFQVATRVQLKKGQAAHILQLLDGARAKPTPSPSVASPHRVIDPDLAGLATSTGKEVAMALREILHEVHFDQVNRDLRLPRFGGDYEIRPFPLPASAVDTHEMKVRLRNAVKSSRGSVDEGLSRRIQQAFSFFMFGQPLTAHALEELFGEARRAAIEKGFALGLFVRTDGQAARMNELSLFSRTLRNGDVVHVFADTPPHFETRAATQRVYAGADSYELMERVSTLDPVSGYCVEMGSGSGIQLIALLKQHPAITKAIGMECDRRAMHVSLFNAALNGVDDTLVIVNDHEGVRRALDQHPISFAMSNPPFLAVPTWIDIEMEDRPALSGLMDVRETEHGCQGDLRTLFPRAGWGGADGLAVTRTFVDALFPMLAAGSQMVIYSQFAGDAEGPRVFEDCVRRRGGFQFAFERVKSRTLVMKQPGTDRIAEGQSQSVFSAAETAHSVARLIIAAQMAKHEPGRLRVSVRTGGPEHVLLMKYARSIEESYRRLGISHFHDGFVVLTRDPMR